MFTVIGFMLTGITVGYLFRNIAFLQKTEKTISITIFLLLFLLGISVGSNELIINNLAAFGWQAAYWLFLLPAAVFWHRDGAEIFLQERR